MRAPVPFEYYGRDGVERLWQAHVVRQAIGYWEDQRTLHETARAASRGVKPAPNATAKSQDRPSTAEVVEDATVCSRNLLPKQRPVTMEPEEPPFAQSHGTSSSSAVAICHSPSTSHAAPQGSGGSGAVTAFGYQYRTCPTCKVTMSAANIGRHICFDSRTSKPLNPRHDQQTCSKCERTFRAGYFQRHACDAPSSMHHRSGTKPQTDIDSDDEPLVKKPAAKRKRRFLSDDEDDSEPDDSVDSDSEPPAKKSTAEARTQGSLSDDEDDAQHVDPVVEPLAKLSLEFDVPNSAWRLRYNRTASGPSLPSESSATEYRVPQVG